MISCNELRWSLSDFLGGRLSPQRDEWIRQHLDLCGDCSEELMKANRVDRFLVVSNKALRPDFTQTLIKQFPDSGIGVLVSRYLAIVFGASAAFAATAYWLINQFIQVGGNVVAEQVGANRESMVLLLGKWLANPTIRYCGFAVLALGLCAVLIMLVDMPRQREDKATY